MDDPTDPFDTDDTGVTGDTDTTGDANDAGTVLTRRELDTGRDVPETQLVEVVAELEESGMTELSPIYGCIDDMIADLFSSPPPAEAEAQLEFTYQGYRIHVRQNGVATFRRASE
ncbi:hypothetical protein GS429_03710 [Natronorubrum sp. JWXQ-INN-674]|uniref:Halobacterial output domain-containing protein n=1 Tax=Natronorubrum halalkaliphilum TaxID=2691917 RepID=A0A6B0VKT7_9EURY|nr:HalOD1 output domain-containing protein [Natronorubrum halalkaliphilum]MXV61179.1 hypothetical protein [Natronorubrum halalkaliphilum]